MKKKFILIIITVLLLCMYFTAGAEQFPSIKIQNARFINLDSSPYISFEEYKKRDYEAQKKYSGIWSTLNHGNLDGLIIKTSASSFLGKNYLSSYICDGKSETAWVEGKKGDGTGEWIKIGIIASKESPSSVPFTIDQIVILPGYFKKNKTWKENNRVKTMLCVLHSPLPCFPRENEWMIYRLQFTDEQKVHIFNIPLESNATNFSPMAKTVWLKIESVYEGEKFDDTCISEVVLVGGCEP